MRLSERRDSEARAAAALIAGRYRIEAPLGKGGAAQVFRVTDVASAAPMALKRLNWNAKQRLALQFELEYQTLASLKHPGIVEVYEYGRDSEGAFYTMELLQGEDLRDRAPIPWRETCRYLRDAAEALGLLHVRRLVHRDISPRNLWRCPSGRVKLIDFGALAPFGTVEYLMGTAPFIPPEALLGQELDQRSDLYSLGALAYYLLTGVQAYPARDPRDLPALWQQVPLPPSQAVAELQRSDLEPIPAELDALVAALMSQNVGARPGSTAELTDRLDMLLGAAPAGSGEAAEIQLSNGAFVARARELRRLRRLLLLSARGRGQCCVIESEAGLGRSRLLRELEISARVTEVTVLRVDAASCSGVYSVASALALKLLDVLPEIARAALGPHAPSLAHATPQLRDRLGVAPLRVRDADVELSVRIQAAFRDWFLRVAATRPLVVLVDGLESTDAGSAAFLLALGLELSHKPLLLVCTSLAARGRTSGPAERELRKLARRLVLAPLRDAELATLLESIFGHAEHLGRLAGQLQRSARGNPGHALELCELLVRRNVIGFAAGTWVLPREVPDAFLAASRSEALLGRLTLLPEAARELGRVLSVHAGVIALDLCRALAKSVSENLFVELGVLLDHEVLVQEREGVRFSHELLRAALRAELGQERRARVRRVLGDYLLSLPDPSALDRLRAGVHLLEGGDERGADLIAQASLRITLKEGSKVAPALPDLEEALALLRARRAPDHELVCVLAPLALAGFQTHRRYATLYGDMALAALEELLGLRLARRLRPRLGKQASLVAGLAFAGARFGLWRKNPRVPRFGQAVFLLFNCVASLTASSAFCLDFAAARRYADALEPFRAYGTKHIAGFMHEFCCALADTASDRPGKTYQCWQQILQRLASAEVIRGIPKKLRGRYQGGGLVASGALEAQRDGGRALRTAERLDESGFAPYRLSAEQTRGLFYAHQGNFRNFERCRQRAEQQAVQQGTSWQVETWATCASTALYMRMHDAMGMKHASEQLQRLSQEIPALDPHARRARGTYLLMRKKYAEALPWLEECLREEPRAVAGWARAHGILARAHNRLGNHEAARGVCLRALGRLDPEDLVYAPFCLIVETELLIAQAGLGEVAQARAGLLRVLARHEPERGPLTMGEVHEAGMEIALLVGDQVSAQRHFVELERWYRSTGAPSLLQRCEALAKSIATPQAAGASRGAGEISADPHTHTHAHSTSIARGMNTVDRMLAGGSMSVADRAHKALQILAEHCRCARGHLYLFDAGGSLKLFASLRDEVPDASLERWAKERALGEADDDETQLIELGQEQDGGADVLCRDGRCYRLLVLAEIGPEGRSVVGAALLGSEQEVPPPCPFEVSQAVGHHLRRALQRDASLSLA